MYCMHFCRDKEIIDWLNQPLLYYGVNSQGGGGGDLSPSTETLQVKKTTLMEGVSVPASNRSFIARKKTF